MRTALFALAAVAPGLAPRAITEMPRPLASRTDSLATLAILVLGLVIVAGAIRSVWKQ
jgi:hypothetical protein